MEEKGRKGEKGGVGLRGRERGGGGERGREGRNEGEEKAEKFFICLRGC